MGLGGVESGGVGQTGLLQFCKVRVSLVQGFFSPNMR